MLSFAGRLPAVCRTTCTDLWCGGRLLARWDAPLAERRRAHGITADGPVVCFFNQHFKIHPGLWRAWARVLARLDG